MADAQQLRPNTKGMVSRRFRQSLVEVRIINANTEETRTKTYEFTDKADPVKLARDRTRLAPGEMILRITLKADRYVLGVMSPEEYLLHCRILEYKPISNQGKDTQS